MAAYSVCPKNDCNSTMFELALATPHNCNGTINVVRCSKCGAVVGVMENINVGETLTAISKHLGVSIPKY